MAINKVILVGNVGRQPEIRFTSSNECIANFSLATTDRYSDKNTGEKKEVTEWHRISCFGKTAEVIQKYVNAGMHLYVEGRIRTREYDKDGVKHKVTEIVANNVQMLGRREDGGQRQQAPQQQYRQQPQQGYQRNSYADAKNGRGNPGYTMPPDNEDIPF